MNDVNELYYKAIFDEFSDAIFIYNAETGLIISANKRAYGLLGYSSVEELNDPDVWYDIESGCSKRNYDNIIKSVLKGVPEIFQWRIKTKAGKLLWVEINIKFAISDGGKFLFSTLKVSGKNYYMAEPESERNITPSKAVKFYNVLLVEDAFLNIELITMSLMQLGHKIFVVENGRMAIEAVKQEINEGRSFDVILMDIQMPVLNGYEASLEIRKTGCVTPIIAMPSDNLPETIELCISSGMDYYMPKPVNVDEIEGVIYNVVENKLSFKDR